MLICELLVEYVPEQAFKELFEAITDLIKKAPSTTKFIFDKRSLRTFHQASMTWYHVEWKPKMLQYSLKTYRKVLPKDTLFRKSVEIGRNKISQDYPTFDWNAFDIQYSETVEEAIQQ